MQSYIIGRTRRRGRGAKLKRTRQTARRVYRANRTSDKACRFTRIFKCELSRRFNNPKTTGWILWYIYRITNEYYVPI